MESFIKSIQLKSIVIRGETQCIENYSYKVLKEGLEKEIESKGLVIILKMLDKIGIFIFILFKFISKLCLNIINLIIVKNKNINTRLAYIDLTKLILTKLPEERMPEVQITILTNCYNLINTSTDIVKLQIIQKC